MPDMSGKTTVYIKGMSLALPPGIGMSMRENITSSVHQGGHHG
jgi:hypothetical protein